MKELDYTGADIDLFVRMERWDCGEMVSAWMERLRGSRVRWNGEFGTGSADNFVEKFHRAGSHRHRSLWNRSLEVSSTREGGALLVTAIIHATTWNADANTVSGPAELPRQNCPTRLLDVYVGCLVGLPSTGLAGAAGASIVFPPLAPSCERIVGMSRPKACNC
jgi:hypothetical protein